MNLQVHWAICTS